MPASRKQIKSITKLEFHCLFYRKIWKGNIEVEYKCDIPYSHLSRARGLEYKYLIVKNKGMEQKELWDCYLKQGLTGKGCDRTLNIPDKMKSSVPGKIR